MTDLRKLHEAATPGPWESSGDAVPWKERQRSPFADQGASIEPDVIVGGSQDEQGGAVGVLRNEDAALIAATRNALPFLLDVVEAARRWVPTVPLELAESWSEGALALEWSQGRTYGDVLNDLRALAALDAHLRDGP